MAPGPDGLATTRELAGLTGDEPAYLARDTATPRRPAPSHDFRILTFEQDLRNNLYRLWNRMSSGSYFPPPVKAVEIPKASGGVRILGVPTVADRIAQTVVAMFLERLVEPIFHPDSY